MITLAWHHIVGLIVFVFFLAFIAIFNALNKDDDLRFLVNGIIVIAEIIFVAVWGGIFWW